MHIRTSHILCFLIAVLAVSSVTASAADTTIPVKISFDKKSDRVDLISKQTLPGYTQAQRGSIQFHYYRLDKPDRFVSFTHDGIRNVQIDDLLLMEKAQQRFAVWRLRYKSGRKNTPRIQHLAVSFIPLDGNGNQEKRVYLLLNDLDSIVWGE